MVPLAKTEKQIWIMDANCSLCQPDMDVNYPLNQDREKDMDANCPLCYDYEPDIWILIVP